jgi:hypothetical protein
MRFRYIDGPARRCGDVVPFQLTAGGEAMKRALTCS